MAQQIEKSLTQVQGQVAKASSLTVYVPTLTPEENRVLAVKYKSVPFVAQKPEDVKTHTLALLLKISVITGWIIPDAEMSIILEDQLQKQLLEKYGHVNPDEVEFAFRMYGTTVKDWGKQMNLSLIDDVMGQYLTARQMISRVEESYKLGRLEYKPKEDMSDEAMEKWVKQLKGQKIAVELLPEMLYEWLLSTGKINPTSKEKWVMMEMAVAYRQYSLSDNKDREGRQALSAFLTQKAAGVFEPKEADQLRRLSKQMILQQYLNS